MKVTDLTPQNVWHFFHEITQVPRPSKKEEKIRLYLKQFASQYNVEYKEDTIGNILMTKPASAGYEELPTILLQSHMDMVCEKNNDTIHDFENDPIQTIIDNEWVRAKGTTLGADNGIGMAYQLAILADTTLAHPKIETLFTVDEEIGLKGAFALEKGLFKAAQMINLDSEDLGEVFIGCAGGIDTVGHIPLETTPIPAEYYFFHLHVKGLKGGHSGCDIHLGLGNANKILTRFLYELRQKSELRISHIDGGNLRNAIPREASCIAGVPWIDKELVRIELNHFIAQIEGEIIDIEPNIQITLESEESPRTVFTQQLTDNLIQALYTIPIGVIGMSRAMPNLVETSTNLASIKIKDNTLIITTSQRSSVDTIKHNIATQVRLCMKAAGATVSQSDGYPGWKPNPDSLLLEKSRRIYQSLYGKEIQIKAIHAGLECGLFLEKYPHLDIISIGPTMHGVHSPNERLHIPSVAIVWEYLLAILADKSI